MKTVLVLTIALIGCVSAKPITEEGLLDAISETCIQEQAQQYDKIDIPPQVEALHETIIKENQGQMISRLDYDVLERYEVPAECSGFAEKVEKVFNETPVCKRLSEDEFDEVIVKLTDKDDRYNRLVGLARACFTGQQ